jgi:hypothetical protein
MKKGSARLIGLDAKGDLLTYLQGARESLVWKLEGSVSTTSGGR